MNTMKVITDKQLCLAVFTRIEICENKTFQTNF